MIIHDLILKIVKKEEAFFLTVSEIYQFVRRLREGGGEGDIFNWGLPPRSSARFVQQQKCQLEKKKNKSIKSHRFIIVYQSDN